MIEHRPFSSLGQFKNDWLDANYHFSFSHYIGRSRMGHGALRVWNDDTIQPHTGFPTHGHESMEIITYVRSGAITHTDSMGNKGRTEAGDVQVMSAGAGIVHAEYNLEDETTNLYQIWIEPRQTGVAPRWDQKAFPKQEVVDALPLLVSGDDDAPLYIHADARIHGGRLNKNTQITHPVRKMAYVLASEGSFSVNGKALRKGDAAEVVNETQLVINAITDCEILVLDVPAAS